MKPRISLPISLTIALVLAACGGSSSDPADDPCARGACTADGGASRDGSTSTDSGARVCMPRCQTHLDCSSTCPTTQLHCCDAVAGACYPTASGSCPAILPDSGAPDSGGLPYP